jgi:OOP family OmpA-OmpF porin
VVKQFKFGVVVLLGLMLSACASAPGKTGWYDQWGACAAAGTAAGMAVGATDDFDSAMYGAAGGFVVGGLICGLSDTDADGVKNFKDKCPGTAAGATVDENGCEIASAEVVGDSDGDGVSDDRDRCPGTPAGAKVDEYGCELDDDGDGVVNSKDKCPGTPPGVAVDNNGCTLEEKYALKNVNFEFDSAKLTADSTASLDEAVQILTRHSDLKVEIAGHTDSTGTDEYNLGLSKRRAQAVVDYLIAHGANAGNITAKGYGEAEPVADNATDTGRAANRRVELRH